MQNTTNFNLQKPDYNNVADIQVLNNNFDKIDNGIAPFFVATLNSSNLYEINTGLSITKLNDGFSVRVAIPSDSTGAVSIIIDGLTAVPVSLAFEMFEDFMAISNSIREKMDFFDKHTSYNKDLFWADRCDDMYNLIRNKAKSIIRKRADDGWGRNFQVR